MLGQPGTALALVKVRLGRSGHLAQLRSEKVMAWNLLLTSDIGLMSLFTILFMVVMAIYIYRYAVKHAAEDAKRNGATSRVPHSQ
jgi:hypothetical protein